MMTDEQIDKALRDLRFRHVDALNRRDPDTFADNFTEDGVWEVPASFRVVGRKDIRHQLANVMTPKFTWVIQTNYDSIVLSATGDRAKARVYFTEYCMFTTGDVQFVLGVYHEDCVHDGDRWRYARRIAHLIYKGPMNLSGELRFFPPPTPEVAFG